MEQIIRDRLLSLHREKLEMIKEILRVTKLVTFEMDAISGDDIENRANAFEACEDYTDLYEKRTVLFSKLQNVLDLVAEISVDGIDSELEEILMGIEAKFKKIVNEIMVIDENNREVYDVLMGHIRAKIKSINQGKKSTNLYRNVEVGFETGHFDQTK